MHRRERLHCFSCVTAVFLPGFLSQPRRSARLFGRLVVASLLVISAFGGPAQAESSAVSAGARASDSERRQLETLIGLSDAAAQAAGLYELVGSATDADVRRYAYRALCHAYGTLLAAGTAPNPDIEARIVAAELPETERLLACYGLLDIKEADSLIGRCLAGVPPELADPQVAAERHRLAGMLALARGDVSGAARALAAAALTIDIAHDPKMHLGLSRAQSQVGNSAAACATARALYRSQPLLPGARDALGACGGNVKTVVDAVTSEAKQALFATRRQGGPALPVLNLESDPLHPVDLDPTKLGKVTVLVFFSTWCPHCAAEMPRMVSFARTVTTDAHLASRTQVLGVRTAVEREKEPYEDFAKRHGVNFRVLTDSTMSLAFAQFAKAAGLPLSLPALVVLDAKGTLRFVLETGDYKDTTRDLGWAVGALGH